MAWSLGAGLDGRVVLVTGAAGGIGREVVAGLVAAGAQVVAVDLHRPALDAALDAPELATARRIAADLADIGAHAQLIAAAQESGPLYGLVHCAAVLRRRAQVADITEDDWDAQVDVNLKGTFFLCRAAADAMRTAGHGGRVVTFSSQGWWTGGYGGSVVYATTKGGVVSMTRGLARAYGPDGITVNAVAPGQARTSMLLDDLDERVLATMTEQTPLGRIAEPAEVAAAAVFLVSSHASFITGTTLNVSGGFLMY
ncbi:SDR family NAD(P)-dependent oxidoreductase [Pseudonocardia sp. GCM10023141]|uniref:SDR family NAD(P)-dependent oxidoreductase n=1 Tax=Pseudonocardia sp. GCM10023141 TaxID=3252653 RepID=UPI003608A628